MQFPGFPPCYVALLYQALLRAGQLPPSGKLPPVVLLVLYNGQRRWQAPRRVEDLFDPLPRSLAAYRRRLRYVLLDEGRYTERALAPLHNLVAAMCRLENSREPAAIQRVLVALIDWLQGPEEESLRRAFTVWRRRVLLPARLSRGWRTVTPYMRCCARPLPARRSRCCGRCYAARPLGAHLRMAALM